MNYRQTFLPDDDDLMEFRKVPLPNDDSMDFDYFDDSMMDISTTENVCLTPINTRIARLSLETPMITRKKPAVRKVRRSERIRRRLLMDEVEKHPAKSPVAVAHAPPRKILRARVVLKTSTNVIESDYKLFSFGLRTRSTPMNRKRKATNVLEHSENLVKRIKGEIKKATQISLSPMLRRSKRLGLFKPRL
jgi:hypothetical protein